MRRLELRSIITKKYKPGSTSKAPDDKENIMNQDFTTLYPNQKWVMDITYIWTIYDGWTYLASIMDLHSKMIIVSKKNTFSDKKWVFLRAHYWVFLY
jgi:putative transposase